jgi:hypothetical protein
MGSEERLGQRIGGFMEACGEALVLAGEVQRRGIVCCDPELPLEEHGDFVARIMRAFDALEDMGTLVREEIMARQFTTEARRKEQNVDDANQASP